MEYAYIVERKGPSIAKLAPEAKFWYYKDVETARRLGLERLCAKLESGELLAFAIAIGNAAAGYFEIIDSLLAFPLRNSKKLEFITSPEMLSPESAALLSKIGDAEARSLLLKALEFESSKIKLKELLRQKSNVQKGL
ncbi:MAG: hypothetical protein ACP5JN_03400 [Candidatus Micrarchaeia archaeon]